MKDCQCQQRPFGTESKHEDEHHVPDNIRLEDMMHNQLQWLDMPCKGCRRWRWWRGRCGWCPSERLAGFTGKQHLSALAGLSVEEGDDGQRCGCVGCEADSEAGLLR